VACCSSSDLVNFNSSVTQTLKIFSALPTIARTSGFLASRPIPVRLRLPIVHGSCSGFASRLYTSKRSGSVIAKRLRSERFVPVTKGLISWIACLVKDCQRPAFVGFFANLLDPFGAGVFLRPGAFQKKRRCSPIFRCLVDNDTNKFHLGPCPRARNSCTKRSNPPKNKALINYFNA
jgi:hypothetical protein